MVSMKFVTNLLTWADQKRSPALSVQNLDSSSSPNLWQAQSQPSLCSVLFLFCFRPKMLWSTLSRSLISPTGSIWPSSRTFKARLGPSWWRENARRRSKTPSRGSRSSTRWWRLRLMTRMETKWRPVWPRSRNFQSWSNTSLRSTISSSHWGGFSTGQIYLHPVCFWPCESLRYLDNLYSSINGIIAIKRSESCVVNPTVWLIGSGWLAVKCVV